MFKNLKIAITDETHLKAVCDVLENIGYQQVDYSRNPDIVVAYSSGCYVASKNTMSGFEHQTLSDLLKMRDNMVKANAKSSQT